jgi:hypothetical protein
MRRFPPPWTVELLDGGFKIVDANKQAIAYVYGHADPRDAGIAKALTLDEARRIASNIAKLPSLTWQSGMSAARLFRFHAIVCTAGRGLPMKEWGPGTGLIIVLLIAIAGKLGVFSGWSDPANWVGPVVLVLGICILAAIYGLVMWLKERWDEVPERTRLLGFTLLLAAGSKFWFFSC